MFTAAVFLACVSNVQGILRHDCIMQKMYGRPCHQSPAYFQRPTFIHMKFPGEDNDEYDGHGHGASLFSMNDFNKIRLRFEDDMRRRFDNLERMIEILGHQISTSSSKMCSCDLKEELRAMQADIIHHCNSSNQGIGTTKSQMTTIATTTLTIPSTVSLSTPTPSITTTITTEPPTTTTAATTTAFTDVTTNNLTPNGSNVHEFVKSETTLATIEMTTPVVDNETIHSTPPVETANVSLNTIGVSEDVVTMTPYNNIIFEDSATDNIGTNLDLTTENIILMGYTPIVNDAIIEEIPAHRNDTLADIDEGVQNNGTVAEVQSDSMLPEHVGATSSSVEVSSTDSITVENDDMVTVRSLESTTGLVAEKFATEATTEEDSGVWVYVKKPAGKLNDSEYWKIEDVVTLPPPKYRNMPTNVRTPKSRTRKGHRNHYRNHGRDRKSQATQLRLVNAKIAGPVL